MHRLLRLAAAIVLLCACESSLDIGASCVRRGDCRAPLVCLSGICRVECEDDTDCVAGQRCLAIEGELACVDPSTLEDAGAVDAARDDASGLDAGPRDASVVDAGSRDASSPSPCEGAPAEHLFGPSLAGLCLSASDGVDPMDHVRLVSDTVSATGFALELDGSGLGDGAWVRVHDERVADEGGYFLFENIDGAVDGGQAILAREAVDEAGGTLGRAGICFAAGSCDCRGADACVAHAAGDVSVAVGIDAPSLYTRVDMRRLARERRVAEVVGAASGHARIVLRRFAIEEPGCNLPHWRLDTLPYVLRESLDRPLHLDAALTIPAGEPIRFFAGERCGNALDTSASALDWSGELGLGTRAVTIDLFLHAALDTGLTTGSFTLWSHASGELRLRIVNRRLRVEAGSCVVEAPTPYPVVSGYSSASVGIDWSAGEVCLAQDGVRVGCATSASCSLGSAPAGGVRFGGRADGGERWTGGIDELRIREGRFDPGARAASGRCYVDLECVGGMVRDAGSRACVAPGACASIHACPAAALTVGASCGAGSTLACRVDATCFEGVAECGGGCVSIGDCRTDIVCP